MATKLWIGGLLAAGLAWTAPRAAAGETEFDLAQARAQLAAIAGDEAPHPIGSEENRRLRARIEQRLTALGYQVEVQRSFVCSPFRRSCGTVENVLTRREGRRPDELVLVNSHYDTQPATPGAGDPMAGVAVVLELARILAAEPAAERGIALLFNDGEEAGLLGSTAFVAEHPWASQVVAVVNLDARGSRGASYLAATIGGNQPILDAWAASAARPRGSSLLPALTALLPNTNDLAVFARLGVPGALFGFLEGARSYHSAADTAANLADESLRTHGEAALGVVRALAAAPAIARARPDAVFVAIGPWMVRWPQRLSLLGLALGVGLVAFAARRAARRGELTGRAFGWGALAALASLVAGAIGAFGVDRLRRALAEVPTATVAEPGAATAALLAGAAAAGLLVAALAARRAGRWGQLCGVALALAVAGLGAVAALPGAAFLAVLPLVATGGLALALGRAGALLGGGLATLLWLSAALSFHAFFGLVATPLSGAAIGLVAGGLAPALATSRARFAPALATLLVAAGALAMAARQPSFTAAQPQFQSLLYVADRQASSAEWIATGWPIPEAWRQGLAFDLDRDAGLPWSRVLEGTPATAPWLSLPGAELHAASGDADTTGRRITGDLRPSGEVDLLQIVVADGQRLRRATIDGIEVPADSLARYAVYRDGYEVLNLWSPPPRGVAVELAIDGAEPLVLELVEWRRGVPAEGRALLALRPAWAQPNAFGDATIVRARVEL